MPKSAALVLFALLACTVSTARADAPATNSLFDPARYMHVSEVKAGMKGYGLSVFRGTKIERFGVEVIDVVQNFNPKYAVVLVRCKGAFLEHTGSIEGMSGSPIFLYDDTGHARMIGAFAYGWPMSKDPIGGVQPIEYMLQIPIGSGASASAAAQPGTNSASASQAVEQTTHARWSLDDSTWKHAARRESIASPQSNQSFLTHIGGKEICLQPLATPLMAGGIGARALDSIAPLFAGSGLTPMQAGGGADMPAKGPPPKLEPGSVLAVPLLTGDAEFTAIGTCTETIGDRMYGFGHHFGEEPSHGEGILTLPMGSGSIATVVANLSASFKLGTLSQPMGILTSDHVVGVAGRIGQAAPMIPIEVHVVYDDGSMDLTYHFQSALHPKLTPLIAAAAAGAALTADRDLPEYHTIAYDVKMDFAQGQSIHIANTSVNAGLAEFVGDIGLPVAAALDNPFKEVPLKRLDVSVHVSGIARSAQIVSVMIFRSKFEPGETLKAYIAYRPFQAEEATLPISLELPRDLPNGIYQLRVTDWNHYLDEEKATNPFKFTAANIDDLFSLLRDFTSIHRNAVYLRLIRQPDGIAVGRTAMPRLPSSSRQVLMDSGRTDITRFVSSTVKVIPTDLVMNGEATFSITIEKLGKVEVAAPKAGN